MAEIADCGVKRLVAFAFGAEDYRAGMRVDVVGGVEPEGKFRHRHEVIARGFHFAKWYTSRLVCEERDYRVIARE